MKNSSALMAFTLSIFLVACGGGGGGGGSTPSATGSEASGGGTPTSPSQDVPSGGTPSVPSPTSPSPSAPGTSTPGSTSTPGTSNPPPASPSDPEGSTGSGTIQLDYSRALSARFNLPRAIATDSTGTLYVTDTGTVRKISPSGDVTTVAGTPGEFGNAATGGNDGTGAAARFNVLSGITVGSDGNIYVTDTVTNEGKIRRITQQGVVTTLANEIYGLGITADGNGNVYFTNNYETYVGVIRPGEAPSVLTRLRAPRGITVDNAGNLYVTNTGLDYGPLGQTTYSCTIDRISPSGQVTTLAGAVAPREFESTCSTIDGTREQARIGNAHGIAVDTAGNVYFTEIQSHTVRRISPDGTVTTIAGSSGNRGAADGTGTAARFNDPRGITIGRDGNLYVADTGNHTIRKVTPQGVVTTVAGKAGESGSTDVPEASATPTSPPATEPPTPSGSTGGTPSPGSTTPTMVTVSTIRGTFNGWRDNNLLIELTNGQIWRQAEYHYEYHYAYMPDVIIYQSGGQFLMQVEGTDRAVAVVRVQ